jgi:hypothetical protein
MQRVSGVWRTCDDVFGDDGPRPRPQLAHQVTDRVVLLLGPDASVRIPNKIGCEKHTAQRRTGDV